MIGMPESARKLLVAYDVAGYSGRGRRREVASQQRLVDVLHYAFAAAQVQGYELQEQGDGGLRLLPTGDGVDEVRVIADLIRALEDGLAEINGDLVAEARIRLRVALDEGVVQRAAHGFSGYAVTAVCRLRDASVVRESLAGSDADLIVVVADHLYQDVLADGYRRGPAFAQATVTAKEFTGEAWIYLPRNIATANPARIPVSGEVPNAPKLSAALRTNPQIW